jgi:hypothetical protein
MELAPMASKARNLAEQLQNSFSETISKDDFRYARSEKPKECRCRLATECCCPRKTANSHANESIENMLWGFEHLFRTSGEVAFKLLQSDQA